MGECAQINVWHSAQTQDVQHICVCHCEAQTHKSVCSICRKKIAHTSCGTNVCAQCGRKEGAGRKEEKGREIAFGTDHALKTKRKLQTMIEVLHCSAQICSKSFSAKNASTLPFQVLHKVIYTFSVHCPAICVLGTAICVQGGSSGREM